MISQYRKHCLKGNGDNEWVCSWEQNFISHGIWEGVPPKRLDWLQLRNSQNCPSYNLESRAIPFCVSAVEADTPVEEPDYPETTSETLSQFQTNSDCSGAQVDVCALLEQDKPQEHR